MTLFLPVLPQVSHLITSVVVSMPGVIVVLASTDVALILLGLFFFLVLTEQFRADEKRQRTASQ